MLTDAYSPLVNTSLAELFISIAERKNSVPIFAFFPCTRDQEEYFEEYYFLLHNSNSFVYNLLNTDPAGSITPPALIFTPGYVRKSDDWYPGIR
jgi:radical SAM superfamily enzyme YgiQ (UPF0313 family)